MWGLLAGIIPFITKAGEQIITSKKERDAQAFELKKIEVEAKARAEMAGQVANAEAIKAEQEAAKQEMIYEAERVKAVSEMQKSKTGIKWIDALLDLNRGLLCFISVVIFFMSAYNFYKTGQIILTQPQLAEIVYMVFSYVLGERSAKKAWGK